MAEIDEQVLEGLYLSIEEKIEEIKTALSEELQQSSMFIDESMKEQVESMMNHEKTYKFCITFGEFRDTYDSEGKIEEVNDFIPDEKAIAENMSKFIGEIEQLPPKYSALKINGKRAYKLARNGSDVEIKPRKVIIKKLEFLGFRDSNTAEFCVECGRGCYVRSLAVDIAKSAGAIGYVSELIRTKVGNFDIENSLNIENIDYNLIEENIINI